MVLRLEIGTMMTGLNAQLQEQQGQPEQAGEQKSGSLDVP